MGDLGCFKLSGAGAKYRLGNQCEVYGEALFGQELYTSDGAQDAADSVDELYVGGIYSGNNDGYTMCIQMENWR
jgi:maltoporin